MTIKILVHFIGLEKKIQKSRNSQLILRCYCRAVVTRTTQEIKGIRQRSWLCILNFQHRPCIGSEMLLWHSNFKNMNLDSHLLPWKKKPSKFIRDLGQSPWVQNTYSNFHLVNFLMWFFCHGFFFNILKSNNKVRWHYYSWYFPSFSELSSSLGEG